MFKKFTAGVLSLVLLFSLSSVVGASTSGIIEVNPERTDRIFELLDQRNALIASGVTLGREIFAINSELASLGVENLTSAEVKQKYGGTPQVMSMLEGQVTASFDSSNSISPQIVEPYYPFPHVKWVDFEAEFYKDGVLYEVLHLTATPSDVHSDVLSGLISTTKHFESTYQVGLTNLVSTVAKEGYTFLVPKADNAIKVFEAVKEFFNDSNFSRTSTVSDISIVYETDYIQNIDYMFVKPSTSPDTSRQLTFITNDVRGDVLTRVPIKKFDANGSLIDQEIKEINAISFYYEATKNRSGMQAIANYFDPSLPSTSVIDRVEVKGMDEKPVTTIEITVPSAPGLIYR